MRDYPYILVAFLEDFDVGYEFERWPHHITVLPWFKADRKALADIESLSKDCLPVSVDLQGTAMFGHKGDTLVRLVESEGLRRFHKSLLSERKGVLGLVNSRHVNEGYRPHLTLQGTDDPRPGPLSISRLSLVKHTGHGKTKRLERNFS